MSKRDYYALIAKMKARWYENTIDLNDASHAKRQAMDGTSVQILNVTDTMK